MRFLIPMFAALALVGSVSAQAVSGELTLPGGTGGGCVTIHFDRQMFSDPAQAIPFLKVNGADFAHTVVSSGSSSVTITFPNPVPNNATVVIKGKSACPTNPPGLSIDNPDWKE